MQYIAVDFRTRPGLIRSAIETHRSWMEEQLGVLLDQCATIETDVDLTEVGVASVLGCVEFLDVAEVAAHRLRALVERAEIPPSMMPRVQLAKTFPQRSYRSLREADEARKESKRNGQMALSWQDCPIAMHVKGLASPIIVWSISYHAGPDSCAESRAQVVIVRREFVAEVSRLIADLERTDRVARLRTLHGESKSVLHCEWNQMILDPQVVSLLKEDFDFFFDSADFFRRMELPHRRGYLLHGPPGNGKTSAVRCMLSSRGLTAYTLRLFDSQIEDRNIEDLFEMAVKRAPSVVLLEDLDRAFPRNGESKSRISTQQLLNSLDGVTTGEGIIVIATANEPALLDPAILRRPGRFDRVVHFPNPSQELREQFYMRYGRSLTSEQIGRIAQDAQGFSFAQLRESVVLAAQRSFERRGEICETDLMEGVKALRDSYSHGSRHSKASGF
jgi:hypothetical protein